MNQMTNPAKINIAHADRLFIDGKWVAPSSDGHIDVVSPHTERICASVAEAREADMDVAVAAARRAFDEGPWPRLTPEERVEYLRKISIELEARIPELANAWVEQIGSLATIAPFVIGGGKRWFDIYADMSATFPWTEERQLNDGPGVGLVIREPVGVVAAIAPWNNPFGIMAGKIAPALLAGCTVIMKPAPETPLEAYIIAEACEAAGLPEGVINLVTSHREAADYLVSSAGIDKVSFTGSVVAGKRIAQVCGQRLARCTLELGGKSAAVILDDFDMGAAAGALAQIISISSGQVCATLSRAIVSNRKKDEFVEALGAAMAAINVGDPTDPSTQMGPLAMKRQLERVESYIQAGRHEGAKLITGGSRPAHLDQGYYMAPTLFADVAPDMRVAQEEIFGPVVSVLTYDTEEEAIRIANNSVYGLYGAVFSTDNEAAMRVARGVRTGTMAQNNFRFDTAIPFGGFKESGIGREGGREGLAGYTELKSYIPA